MTKQSKKTFSSIVTIDCFDETSFKFEKNELKNNSIDKYDSDSYYISYVKAKDILSTPVEISSAIPEEDIKDAIEIKAYEEMGLDATVKYDIAYVENSSMDPKNKNFHVLAINSEKFFEDFKKIKNKVKYIDNIFPVSFLIKSLYIKNYIEPRGVHCFVYFQQDDAFLAIYKDAQFVYSKSIRYSLESMSENFSQILGERYDLKDFSNLISKDGFETLNQDYKIHLEALFDEVFSYINDVLLFAQRTNSIDSIDSMYIGTAFGPIPGVLTFAKNYFIFKSLDFNFNIAINTKNIYIDQIQSLMVLTALVNIENGEDEFNISIFKRPPPFKNRDSGKLILFIITISLLSFAYPLYQTGYTAKLKFDKIILDEQYSQLLIEANEIRGQIALLEGEKNKINSLYLAEKEKLSFREKLLQEIYAKKVDYPMKANILKNIFIDINKYGLNVLTLNNLQNDLNITVFGDNEKDITELIQKLSKTPKYEVKSEKIFKDENESFYESVIEVDFNDKN